MRISLHRSLLTYCGGLAVHTASSGRIAGLDTLYLSLRDADGVEAAGEVRINVAYLNGLSPETLLAEALALLPRLNLERDAAAVANGELATASAPIRMLVDMALHDLAARRAGLPLAVHLGAHSGCFAHPTNQTLFVSDEATFLSRADAYANRGFHDLKVRIGGAEFETDLARLRALRSRFGSDVTLAADANGAWSLDDAPRHLEALAPFDLAYVEQPVAPRPFEDLARLAEASPVPVMLDESVGGERDVADLAAGGHRLMAHLKLVKLGGIAPTLDAARRLTAAGVPIMVGQMNEGGLATAAALHVALVTRPRFAELYGADGIEADPAPGLIYADGELAVPALPGLGLPFLAERTRTLWEN